MVKVFGIEFAPLWIPLERRLQTFSLLLLLGIFSFFPIFFIILFVYLLFFTNYYFISIGYFAWMFYDINISKTSSRGGRRIERVRSSKLLKYFRDYFPVKLHTTNELDPNQNYIIGSHPHGILGCGTLINFACDITGFSKKYPGIKCYPLTLKLNFKWPVLREVFLWFGICDVSRKSLEWILTQQGKGNAAVITVGGAQEALDSHPGVYRLTLKNRKGFVKAAIRTGSSLVPAYSFGETDLFYQADNPHGSMVRRFQETVKRLIGVSPALFYGRGVFNYNFGFLPHRRPINTVLGSPIHTIKMDSPSQADIDQVHRRYMDKLTELFDKYKQQFGLDETVKLEFV